MQNFEFKDKNELELREKLSKLKIELLTILDVWYDMVNVKQPHLEFMYESIFGDLEIELDEKYKTVTELDRRVELLSWKLKRGERINKTTVEFVDTMIKREFGYEKSYKNESDYNDVPNNTHNQIQNKTFNLENKDNEDMPSVYRALVKKLHPDVSGESELYKRFWNNIQSAYKERDIQRLRLFKQTICSETSLSNEELLLQELRKLEANIEKERHKLENLMKQEPFVLEEKLNDRTWIMRRKKALRDRVFQIDRKISFNKKIINSLTMGIDKQTKPQANDGSRYFTHSNTYSYVAPAY